MGFWSSIKRLTGLFGGDEPSPAGPRTTTYAGDTGLIEITTPAPGGAKQRPALPELERAHHQFIASNWARLAAAAYAGFRRHGIGVVVIEKRGDTSVSLDAFEMHDLAYATGMGMWTQRPPHSTAPGWLDEQFQNYEPLEAGLFLFRTTGDASSRPPRPYHVAGTPAPPDALKQTRAPFN